MFLRAFIIAAFDTLYDFLKTFILLYYVVEETERFAFVGLHILRAMKLTAALGWTANQIHICCDSLKTFLEKSSFIFKCKCAMNGCVEDWRIRSVSCL